MSTQPIKVMVVDDHTILQESLATFFETVDDLVMVGAASNGEEAIRLCALLEPDVVLMDLIMPIMDGVSATRIIHDQYPQIKIIVLIPTLKMDCVYSREGETSGKQKYTQVILGVGITPDSAFGYRRKMRRIMMGIVRMAARPTRRTMGAARRIKPPMPRAILRKNCAEAVDIM
jgi:CheY-like chemotaxis protein